ncbi:MAG TPA: STN domain-containing protein, partial [Planctomycetota bacterium]|nr:STN domain-containing protein [Planctomycetota bacterium]
EFAIARACSLDGRAEAASTTLEKLADLSGDASAGPWPARAREALDRLATGESAFLPEVRGRGQLSLEATAKPLFNVLRDLAGRTSVSFALDASCPEAWTVSVALGDLSLEELLDKLVGQGRWRRVGDGVAIGDCAANGPAWERPWSWGQVEDRAGRALGARLCTTRVSLNFPAIKLSEALAKINVLGVCEVSAAPGQGDRVVRVIAKDLRLDQALDLLAAPLGLAWTIAGDKVSIGPRKEKGE